jgi:hypothetical protein
VSETVVTTATVYDRAMAAKRRSARWSELVDLDLLWLRPVRSIRTRERSSTGRRCML